MRNKGGRDYVMIAPIGNADQGDDSHHTDGGQRYAADIPLGLD